MSDINKIPARSEHFVLVFDSSAQAMELESKAKALGLPGRSVPLPGEISSGCGLCYAVPMSEAAGIELLLSLDLHCAAYDNVMMY